MNWINRNNESYLEKLLINFIISNPELCLGREDLLDYEMNNFTEHFSFIYTINQDKSEISVITNNQFQEFSKQEFTVTVLELITHLYGKLQTLVFKI